MNHLATSLIISPDCLLPGSERRERDRHIRVNAQDYTVHGMKSSCMHARPTSHVSFSTSKYYTLVTYEHFKALKREQTFVKMKRYK